MNPLCLLGRMPAEALAMPGVFNLFSDCAAAGKFDRGKQSAFSMRKGRFYQ
ncbi:hypothetical protein [Bacillus sp. MSP13]|uniref:hypothetical protein n=1 Tax=Bacillus sp. MSP13 TaxID=1071061 RepID=UPI0012E09E2F|nr:hypothetical protein [Bacillus sp. MSP13]